MGAGKTSVAKELGSLLNLPVVETDKLVLEKTNSKDMLQVFEKGGEVLLRETEIKIAEEAMSWTNVIVSTGGGFALNKMILKGKVVFLDASFQTIVKRLEGDKSRPLFCESLYHARKPLYLKYADLVIQVDYKTTKEIAGEIVNGK